MIQVNAMGDACPIPVVKTKNAIKELNGAGVVETLVDNEIAVQNLTKMANQKGYGVKSEKLGENEFKVTMTISENASSESASVGAEGSAAEGAAGSTAEGAAGSTAAGTDQTENQEEQVTCAAPAKGKNVVVVISSAQMGSGNDELGTALMKGFIYALGQQEILPKTIIFYNGGASIPCEDSVSLEDLKSMEAQGVEILTCGTCLNFYGLSEKLAVGSVTNMYVIAEKMTQADLIVKP